MRISWKIFGVSLIVFAVMACASAFSIFKISEINAELHSISNVFAPLAHEITEIEVVALEEELHLERIEKLEAEMRADRLEAFSSGKSELEIDAQLEKHPELQARIRQIEVRLKAEMEIFEKRAATVRDLVKASEERVKSAQASARSTTDRLELAALFPSLVAVEAQHDNFHSHAVSLVTAASLAPETREKLEEQLEEEETKLTERLEALRERVSTFTDNAIRTAALHEQQALYAGIGATGAAGLLALLLSSLVISGILRPMRALASGAKRVENGDLEIRLEPQSSDEIGALTNSFNSMVDGLQSTQKIKDTFGQYLDPRVVSGLIGDRPDALVGEKKVVSAYFSDLADFTTISEQFTPSGLVRVLNRYLDMMSVPITDRQGVIDKYIGDAIMAFWAPPFCADGQQADLAVASALKNAGMMRVFQTELPDLTGLQKNLPAIHQRIGIATGDAVIGSIGSEKTKNYTIMGDTVNLGARLEGANKIYGTGILVCERTRNMASGFEFRAVDRIQVKGKTEPTSVYTPLCASVDITPDLRTLQESSEAALRAFALGDWDAARQSFESIRASSPDDTVASVFLNRLDLIATEGVPDNWDGVWHLTKK